jgi:2-polyprenyl-3-methyl-5-hydroxy-6-metoxy-1,4-benzoquinol methylase
MSDKFTQTSNIQPIRNCYLCNHQKFRSRKGAVRDDPSLKVLECAQCGLVVLDSFQHISADHYEDSGMHNANLPSIESWLKEVAHDDQRRIEMLKASMVNCRLLDFGCGAAGFLRKAQAIAVQVVGIEPERRVREYWGDTIELYGSLEYAGEGYDLITAFHVIEHLPDPRVKLKELAARLKGGGRLVIEVPSSEDILLTLYENEAFQRFTYWSQHLYLFNGETLRRLAEQAGLRVVSIQQFQRYPLSNHLHWLSRIQPGGHQNWSFIDTPALIEAYAASLASIGKCDTIIAYLENK